MIKVVDGILDKFALDFWQHQFKYFRLVQFLECFGLVGFNFDFDFKIFGGYAASICLSTHQSKSQVVSKSNPQARFPMDSK